MSTLARLPRRVRREMGEIVRKLRAGWIRRFSGVRGLWNHALPGEVEFWDTWLDRESPGRGGNYRGRLNPDVELQPELRDLLADCPGDREVRVLDVGAGPLTSLGKKWDGRDVRITAVDPLAVEYNDLLDRRNLVPPVRTVYGCGERLLDLFPRATFDLAYSCNALDHSYDPVLAIRQMLGVTRPGGWVYLRHRVREASRRGHRGLHQWDFYLEDGTLRIESMDSPIDVARELDGEAELRCHHETETLPDGKRYEHVVAVLQKASSRAGG